MCGVGREEAVVVGSRQHRVYGWLWGGHVALIHRHCHLALWRRTTAVLLLLRLLLLLLLQHRLGGCLLKHKNEQFRVAFVCVWGGWLRRREA